MDIGQKIRDYRRSLGITGKELGNLSGTSQSTISEIEADKRSPSLDTLEKICLALDVRLIDLLEDHTPLDPLDSDLLRLINIAKKLTYEERLKVIELLQTMAKGKI